MFTGIIQGQGGIVAVESAGKETRLRIRPLFVLSDIVVGESIAANGVCLTVETHGGSRDAAWYTCYASAETMRLTTLADLRTGDRVNLERALAMGDRLGGHMVAGHVDCVATVAEVREEGQSRRYRLKFPQEFGPQVIPKGSVALDGVSLTVNHCGPDFLEVNVIPETQRVTTIAGWKPGVRVNMETDLIGKYVQRMLSAWQGGPSATGHAASGSGGGGALTVEFLKEHGF